MLSEGDWTVSSNADWLTVDKSGGTATGDVTEWVFFIPNENTTGAVRTTDITLTSKANTSSPETIKVKVTQGTI